MEKQYRMMLCAIAGMVCGIALVRLPLRAAHKVQTIERMRKLSEDLQKFQLWILLAREFTPLIKDEYTIGGIAFPAQIARETALLSIEAGFNAAELCRVIIKIVTEQARPVNQVIACLRQSDQVLKAAAQAKMPLAERDPALKDVVVPAEVANCADVMCSSRRRCVAKLLVDLTGMVSEIFNNAVINYDPKAGTAQRGFLMNIDLLLETLLKRTLDIPSVRDYLLAKKIKVREGGVEKEVTARDRIALFIKRLDSLRTVLTYLAEGVSGGLNALNAAALAIDPSVVPEAQRAQLQENSDASLSITDKDLETLYEQAAKARV